MGWRASERGGCEEVREWGRRVERERCEEITCLRARAAASGVTGSPLRRRRALSRPRTCDRSHSGCQGKGQT